MPTRYWWLNFPFALCIKHAAQKESLYNLSICQEFGTQPVGRLREKFYTVLAENLPLICKKVLCHSINTGSILNLILRGQGKMTYLYYKLLTEIKLVYIRVSPTVMVNDEELGDQSSISGSGWGFSFRHHITLTLAPTHSRGQQGYFSRGQTDHTVKAYLPSPNNEIRNVCSCNSIPRKSSWHHELWSTGTNFAFLLLIYTNYVPFSKPCLPSSPSVFLSSSSGKVIQETVCRVPSPFLAAWRFHIYLSI